MFIGKVSFEFVLGRHILPLISFYVLPDNSNLIIMTLVH